MKVAICDYKEPLNRDLEIEKSVFKKFLGEDTEISLYVHEGDNEKFKEAIKDVDGILTSYLEFPKEIINSNPNLKGISIEATGYNFVDADAAQEQGTAVAVIGEYCTQEVADHSIALMLAVARKLKHYDREIEYKHVYDYNSTSGMIRLEGSTFGILGLGIFGQSVLKTLQDQDVDIIAIDDHADVINQYESMITTGIVGDITEMDLLDAADIGTCDTVVIATGENLESSVLAVMHCKALGVEHVIAKVKNEVTKEVL